MPKNDEEMMLLALQEAKKAADADEVPIGAVLLTANGEILACGHNLTITQNDPTAHAEINALRRACRVAGNYRLTGTTLYSTIEPCIMCMGALVHARVSRVVFGAYDEKWGGCGSICDFSQNAGLNHSIQVKGGVLMEECRELMRNFFAKKRGK